MSDGTSLDALESGEIANTADASHVQAILKDMYASGAQPAEGMPSLPPPQMQQRAMELPPHVPPAHLMRQSQQQQQQQRQYIQEDEPVKRKRNIWSSILSAIQDPLVVSLLVFVLSLPVLHTFLGKYAGWAFAIGGQLSWLGLIALSLLAGSLFGCYKVINETFF